MPTCGRCLNWLMKVSNRMNLLLVNDDGFNSANLRALCRAAAARGHRVTVCAPSSQQSAKGHSFTVFQPLMAHPRRMDGAEAAWTVDGTPVDCARLGLMELCPGRPDLVMSGINCGYNTGLATFVSGTVGAAREAAFQGIPAMAVSAAWNASDETVAYFADWAVRLAECLVSYPAPEMSVCNVNVPALPPAELKEARMGRISRNVYRDGYERRISPRGDVYFWLNREEEDEHPAPGSDLAWLNAGHISCTFLVPDGECEQEKLADILRGL